MNSEVDNDLIKRLLAVQVIQSIAERRFKQIVDHGGVLSADAMNDLVAGAYSDAKAAVGMIYAQD
jgi:hypothetical protein